MARTRRTRLHRRALGTLFLIIGMALLSVAAALYLGDSDSTSPTARRSSTTATLPAVTTFRLARAEVPATGAAVLPDPVLSGVLATLNRYLDGAVVVPLRSGAVASDLPGIFTAAAAQRLGGPDRATLVDEGITPAGRAVGIEDAAVSLTGLLDNDGSISVVAAHVDVVLRAGAGAGAMRVARSGELVLVPDAGAWKIDGYDLTVTRDTVPATTTSEVKR